MLDEVLDEGAEASFKSEYKVAVSGRGYIWTFGFCRGILRRIAFMA